MATGALATCVQEVIDRINSVVGDGTARVRDERAIKEARTDVGFAGALGGDRNVVPTTRERIVAVLVVRSVLQARSGQGTIAVLERHEPVLRALVGFVPSPAEDLILGETRPVDIELGNREAVALETEYQLRIELERR